MSEAIPTSAPQLPAVARPQIGAMLTAVVGLYDVDIFMHMQRIAKAMAMASMLPDNLRGPSVEATTANMLVVVNQARQWRMDPWALANETAIIHGRFCYSAKAMVAAVQAIGIEFEYEYFGTRWQEDYGVRVTATVPGTGQKRTVEGFWKHYRTRDKNGNIQERWISNIDQMLGYRGAKDWIRRYQPAALLGAMDYDETIEMLAEQEAYAATQRPRIRTAAPKLPPSEATAQAATRIDTTATTIDTTATEVTAEPKASEPPAAAAETVQTIEEGEQDRAAEPTTIETGDAPLGLSDGEEEVQRDESQGVAPAAEAKVDEQPAAAEPKPLAEQPAVSRAESEFADIRASYEAANSVGEMDEIARRDELAKLFLIHGDEWIAKAEALYDEHLARLTPKPEPDPEPVPAKAEKAKRGAKKEAAPPPDESWKTDKAAYKTKFEGMVNDAREGRITFAELQRWADETRPLRSELFSISERGELQRDFLRLKNDILDGKVKA